MKKPSKRSTKPPKRRSATNGDQMNQATTEEFEREEMGIAPKE